MSVRFSEQQLPDVAAGQQCPFCGEEADAFNVEWEVGPFALHLCAGGNSKDIRPHPPVLLSFPWESEEEYEAWYADAKGAYHVTEQLEEGCGVYKASMENPRHHEFLEAAKSRLDFLRGIVPLTPHSSIMDIGAGSGEFVTVARARGFRNTYGIEPNPTLSLPGMVGQGTWKDVTHMGLPGDKTGPLWDVITMFDVFEHLTRPKECLLHLRECLAPSGVLVIEMPEFNSLPSIRDREKWKHIRPRQHVCLWSDEAFRAYADALGFYLVGFNRPLMGGLGKATWVLMKKEDV